MGRPGLTRHRKFARLSRLLNSMPMARGCLELLWEAAYEDGNDLLGNAQDVEYAAHWSGQPGVLITALVDSGFVDQDGENYRVHDLFDHCPDYVRRRLQRERQRQDSGTRLRILTSQRPVSDTSVTSQRPVSDTSVTPTPAPAPAPIEEPPIFPQGGTRHTENSDIAEKPPPPKPRKRKPRVEDYDERFEQFWAIYPPLRKTGKRKAWQAWQSAITREFPDLILAAVKEFAMSPYGRGGFCPLPATWLNQNRWEDDRKAWQHSGDDRPGAPHEPVEAPMKEY